MPQHLPKGLLHLFWTLTRAHQHIAPIALVEHLDTNRPTLIQLTAYKHAVNLQKLTASHPNCRVKKCFALTTRAIAAHPGDWSQSQETFSRIRNDKIYPLLLWYLYRMR